MNIVSKFLILGRSWINSAIPPLNVPTVDGVPTVPAVDGNGVWWVRIVGMLATGIVQATNAIITSLSGIGALVTVQPGNWSVNSDPAANTQATTTRAGVAGVSHVCTSISASLSNNNAAATGILKVYLRDGLTGVGAILWSANIQAGPNTGTPTQIIELGGLNIVGTAGNAMTLEFSAAGGANTQENVSLTGYNV